MQSPRIIEGESFDWEEGNRHMENVVDDDGNTSMYHAMGADPGVTKCPNCGKFYWREGTLVECKKCETRWNP